MMRRYCQAIFGLILLGAVSWVGCQVAFEDLQKEETFECEDDGDCIDGFVCDTSRGLCVKSCESNTDCSDNLVCRDEVCVQGCIDKDGDGYGAPESEALALCEACQQSQADDPIACRKPDCKEQNETIYPGQVETCDGVDNDCDGTVDEPILCGDANGGDCSSLKQATNVNRKGASISCETVNRGGNKKQDECVLTGDFEGNTECPLDQNQAFCNNGSWDKVPEKCTEPP